MKISLKEAGQVKLSKLDFKKCHSMAEAWPKNYQSMTKKWPNMPKAWPKYANNMVKALPKHALWPKHAL